MKRRPVIFHFFGCLEQKHISAYAAETTYYVILSALPFFLLLLTLFKFTPLSKEMFTDMIEVMIPSAFAPVFMNILDELYNKATAAFSISIVVALWSASRGIMAMTKGFNLIYNVKETRNFIVLTLRSIGYTFALVVTIVISLVVMVFGEGIHGLVEQHFPVVASVIQRILDVRMLLVLIFLLVIFLLVYKFIPNRKIKLLYQLPGALFSTFGWMLFTYLFTIYVQISDLSYMYGSLTIVILVMLWIYFSLYMIFVGAEINMWFETWKKRR